VGAQRGHGVSVSAEYLVDLLEPGVMEPVEDLRVDPLEYFDAVACPLGYLLRWYSGVEADGDPGVPEVVRALQQDRSSLVGREADLSGLAPNLVVGARTDRHAVDAAEDPAVLSLTEVLKVPAAA
jgi:hypothetical protein